MVRLDYTIKVIFKIYLWRTYLFMFGFLRDIIIIFIAFPLLPVIKQPSISNLIYTYIIHISEIIYIYSSKAI